MLGWLRLAGLCLQSLFLFPPIWLANTLGFGSRTLCRFYWQVLVAITGSRVEVSGTLANDRPLLCVANHVSYLDILFLGSVIPGVFVSKADVRRWPIFGSIAVLGQTIFMDRSRAATTIARDTIRARLADGDPVILFPEATSSPGNHVIPFKSALFNVAETAAEEPDVVVQPVTVAYRRLHGMPLNRAWRPFVAWFGDMEFAEHAWDFMKLGGVTVEVTFHDPVSMDRFGSRKDLARHCQSVIEDRLAQSHSGRFDATTPLFPPPSQV